MYRSLLAAVDASPTAPAVLAAALEIAERFDARVHLYRVVLLPQEFPAGAHQPPDDLPTYLEREARQDMERLANGHTRVQVLPPEVGFTQPWRAIVAASHRLQVDLIVIGSHSHSRWDLILGTHSARVANHASRSVLIVRAGGDSAPS